jgi:hypothetical protein
MVGDERLNVHETLLGLELRLASISAKISASNTNYNQTR